MAASSAFSWSIPLWGDRWSKELLLKRESEIGRRAFDRGFRQKALSDSEKIFPMIEQCIVPGDDPFQYVEDDASVFIGVDPSGENRPGTCIFVLARLTNGTRVPIYIEYGKWKPEEAAQKVIQANKDFRPDAIFFENNALQEAYISLIKLSGGVDIPIRGFHTGKQKSDPTIGLPSLEIEFENKAWIICEPQHEIGCLCDWHHWLREMRNYPVYSSSDGVMAAWFAREAARLQIGGWGDVDKMGVVSRWTRRPITEPATVEDEQPPRRIQSSRWKRGR